MYQLLLLLKSNKKLKKNSEKKEPNKYIPAYCIPTKEVIKYFDLDIEFLKSLIFLDKDDIQNYFSEFISNKYFSGIF